jgi:formiminotetrahydrofolate cyclodeaminase
MEADRPFADLLAALAHRTPAPGGGSAAAWGGALAAALLEMAALYADQTEVAARAASLRAELLALGERELESYAPVLAALRLGTEDSERPTALAAALSEACEAPLAIARAAAEVAELASVVAGEGPPALNGDAIAGVVLAEAACQAAARLVDINLAGDRDDPRLAEVATLRLRAAGVRDRALG